MLGVLVRRTFYSERFLRRSFSLSLCSDVISYINNCSHLPINSVSIVLIIGTWSSTQNCRQHEKYLYKNMENKIKHQLESLVGKGRFGYRAKVLRGLDAWRACKCIWNRASKVIQRWFVRFFMLKFLTLQVLIYLSNSFSCFFVFDKNFREIFVRGELWLVRGLTRMCYTN